MTTIVPAGTIAASDHRKLVATFFLAGGGVVMSIFALVAMWLVAGNERYVYHLGLFAMLNNLMIFTGLVASFAKRTLNVSRNGIVVEDQN